MDEYSFMTQLKMLWRVPPLWGPHMVRKWERRLILSLEYLVKAQYATVITVATKAAYGDADSEILIVAGMHCAGSCWRRCQDPAGRHTPGWKLAAGTAAI